MFGNHDHVTVRGRNQWGMGERKGSREAFKKSQTQALWQAMGITQAGKKEGSPKNKVYALSPKKKRK